MQVSVIERFDHLIAEGEKILSGRTKGGGERKRTGNDRIGGLTYRTEKFDMVDRTEAIAWAEKCLSLIEHVGGRDSGYYIKIAELQTKFSTTLNYMAVQTTVKLMDAARDDFANGFVPKPTTGASALETAVIIEAERNVRIYLALVFVLYLIITAVTWYFWGWQFATGLGLVIPLISFLATLIKLKEYSLSKIHERFLEIEIVRLRNRFKEQH